MEKTAVLDKAETALLVIDVQRGLFTRPTPVHKPYKLIETLNALIARSRLYGVRVFYIQHENESFLKKGTSGWDLHPDLSVPTSTDILIQKTNGSAFVGTNLRSSLEARNIRNLIITGMVTQGCVRATSLGGLELGYRIFLVKGGHSNYDKDPLKVIDFREKELSDAGVFLVAPERIDFA